MTTAARWLAALLGVLVIGVMAGTFVPRPFWSEAQAQDANAPAHRILVLSNPVHTDIAIPLDETTRAHFAFLRKSGFQVDHPGAAYLIVGWGGRSFYLETPTWGDVKPMPVFRALTVDQSVMHVDLASEKLADEASAITLSMDARGYDDMLAFIAASFSRNGSDPIIIPDKKYGRYDAFFEARGHFNALIGCNTWTAQALRKGGIRTGWWNPAPQTLAISLGLYN